MRTIFAEKNDSFNRNRKKDLLSEQCSFKNEITFSLFKRQNTKAGSP